MKYHKIYLSLFFISTLLMQGCDPTWEVGFSIENQTNQNIDIKSVLLNADLKDVDNISKNTSIFLHNNFGIGSTTADYLGELETIIFDTLLITTADGKSLKKDALDINNWEKIFPTKDGELGEVRLTVSPNDFE